MEQSSGSLSVDVLKTDYMQHKGATNEVDKIEEVDEDDDGVTPKADGAEQAKRAETPSLKTEVNSPDARSP